MRCPTCGEEVREGWQFCPRCWQSQTEQDKPRSGATDVTEGGPEAEVRVTPDFKPWSTVEHGSLWRRACAELVDVMFAMFLLGALIPAVREALEDRQVHWFVLLWGVEILFIPYRVVAEWSKWQATLGKWLLGLAVTD